MKNKKNNCSKIENRIVKLFFILIVIFLIPIFVKADGWAPNQPSHQTLYSDTITSKTDSSSVNIADSQGLFVTGDIKTLGNVGIGTTTPQARLQVGPVGEIFADGARAGAYISDVDYDLTQIGQNGILALRSTDSQAADKGGTLTLGGAYANNIYTKFAAIKGAKEDGVEGNYGGYISFYTRTNGFPPAERMRINPGGNVGIGTTSPKSPLSVYGDIIRDDSNYQSPLLEVGGPNGAYRSLGIYASPQSFPKTDGTTNEWSANGAPWAVPMIYRSMRYPNAGTGSFPNNDYGELILQGVSHGSTNYNRGISFATWDGISVPAIRMRIDPNGNVGIGTTNPTAKLDVNGKGHFSGGVDPPYISFSNESHESIRQYAKTVAEHEKVMQFWNEKYHRMEIYVISEDKFYTINGELINK